VKRSTILLFLFLAGISFSASSADRPRLVVYISIDQMKAEYLEWYKAEFTRGFRRFLTDGAVLRNGDLNYAPSETGPGHAALGTGAYPCHSGIVSNEWSDPTTGATDYCVEDSTASKVDGEGGFVSPRNLRVSGLADWWKKNIHGSKVIGASLKDRAAILMSGQHPDCAFWYEKTSGDMVTSGYYVNALPAWARAFNESHWIDKNLPEAWTKLLPDSVYTKYGPDEFKGEAETNGSTSFPHAFTPAKKRSQISTSPYGDQMVLDFARAAVHAEKLGQRGVSDLLIVSLSCTDYIGHAYGGNSHEMIDQLIRLDVALGAFFDEAEQLVGKGSVLFVLSADHAALPLPEYLATVQHLPARRVLVKTEIYPAVDSLDASLRRALNVSKPLIKSYAFLDYAAARNAGVDSLALEQRVKTGLLAIDGIADVFFRRDILNPANSGKRFPGYNQRGYFIPRGRDFLVVPREYYLFTSSKTGTSHGTAYAYDTRVPILFMGTGVTAGQFDGAAHTVDIAPTIARIMGLPIPQTVDGVVLTRIMK